MKAPLVLVVDDDPDILEAICDILEVEGYAVARARHGGEALARVEEERPALILLDLMMPVMDGLSFAAALRARPAVSDVPIVVISADGNRQRADPIRAAGYLAKPFDVETLLTHVARLCGGRPDAAAPAR